MKRIGKYIIRGLLGRGGMARVYKVELPVIGKIAALKRLDPTEPLEALMGMAALRQRFTAEARAMATLRHPNILDVLDFDEDGGRPFYVMEFYANNLGGMIGETYRAETPSRRIRVDRAAAYGRQMLDGLARLHDADIVHRDIKPFNLLVTETETVKIGDFGLSKLRGETRTGPATLKVGSPYYAPPEQETAPDSVDRRADLFAAGVTLFRMLTGELPETTREPASRMNPELDAGWDAFFTIALQKDPARRFPGAREMRDALALLHIKWQERQARLCELTAAAAPAEAEAASGALRREPVKMSPGPARRFFGLDRLGRPERYLRNAHRLHPDGTVRDTATGCVWEQSGSPYPLTWAEARRRVDILNRAAFAGRRTWRLPTIAELASLLTPTPDFCVAPVFDPTQKWLWSCDRRSFTAAWYVNVDLGFVAWQDMSAPYYCRAVSSG